MNLLSLPSRHHLSSLAGSRSFHSLRRYLLSTFGTEQWGFSTVMGSYHYCGRDKKKIEKRYNKDDSQGHLLQGKGTHRSSVVMIRKSPLPSRGPERGMPLVYSVGQKKAQSGWNGGNSMAGCQERPGKWAGADGHLDCSTVHSPLWGRTSNPPPHLSTGDD